MKQQITGTIFHMQKKNTIGFIGSDKNAGKTTALNFVAMKLRSVHQLAFTSIGINGEEYCRYEGDEKPEVKLKAGDIFITCAQRLTNSLGLYEIINQLTPPTFKKEFVMARALHSLSVILEGPNDKEEILLCKKVLFNHFPDHTLLLDGSIDRQFMADPKVCDSFYFAALKSSREGQTNKAQAFLDAIALKEAPKAKLRLVESFYDRSFKSLLFDQDENLIYEGTMPPALDQELSTLLYKNAKATLFLKGALTPTLLKSIRASDSVTLILDNFTLYQNISTEKRALPHNLFLFHPVKINAIFVRNDSDETLPSSKNSSLNFPVSVPIYDLYTEELHEMAF